MKGQRILPLAGVLLSALVLFPSKGEAQRTVCLTPTQDMCVTFSPFYWTAVNTTVDGLDDEYALNGTVSFGGGGSFGSLTPLEFDFRWNQGFALSSPQQVWGYGAMPSVFPGSVMLQSGFYDANNFTPASPFYFAEALGTPDPVALADVDLFGILWDDGSYSPCALAPIPGRTTFMDRQGRGLRVLAAGIFPMMFQLPGADPDCYEPLSVVPEPMTVIMLATGLLAVGGALRRRSMELEIEEDA